MNIFIALNICERTRSNFLRKLVQRLRDPICILAVKNPSALKSSDVSNIYSNVVGS